MLGRRIVGVDRGASGEGDGGGQDPAGEGGQTNGAAGAGKHDDLRFGWWRGQCLPARRAYARPHRPRDPACYRFRGGASPRTRVALLSGLLSGLPGPGAGHVVCAVVPGRIAQR
ncbi:hypothetical protein GCM10018779_49170 [Streptomyces griseocarneus]|nr:hypothetical protein GCM10018779_49170 [Streptomyces griseocarneus]